MNGTDQFFELPRGMRLHYVEWGDAKRTPLVLLHGWMDIAHSWDRVAPKLAEHFHVLALEFRGHGLSDMLPGGAYFHFQDYLLDVHGLLQHTIGEKPFVLVGHSMGGMVASQYAGSFPKRIIRFVNIEGFGPPPMEPQDAPTRYADWIATWFRAATEDSKTYESVQAAAARLRKSNPRLSEEFSLHLATHATVKGKDGLYRFRFDQLHRVRGPQPFIIEQARSFWKRVACPTLVIVGEKSEFQTLTPDWRERAACYPNSRISEIAGAGHMIHHEKPEELSKLLLSFLLES